jgi:uncharacterized oxidoreductase
MDDGHLIPAAALSDAMRVLVRGFGSAPAEVDAVVANLVEANLTGHDSHGVGMLPRYVDAFLEGELVPNARVELVHDAGTLLRLDGAKGFGQVIGAQAMALGVERARAHGQCIVALGRSHHLGRIGAWAEACAAAGLVSIHFVNVISRGIVAPHGGADARFGTNPVCIGVPVAGRAPVILDFATSEIAQGKARVAHNRGVAVPEGSLIDAQGRPSTDPRWAVVPPFGALLTFGAHKGYGLALVAELLGGALAAGTTQRDAASDKRRVWNGMFSVIVDPSALGDAAAFAHEAAAFVDWVKASPPREGFDAVRVAGEPEAAMRLRRRAEGIPMDDTTWDEILAAAKKLGVDPLVIERAAGKLRVPRS